jgi:hypothetical protein
MKTAADYYKVGRERTVKKPKMKKPKKKIFVTVSGGMAEVHEETIPKGYEVEIIDFDNISQGDDYPSEEAEQFAKRIDE